ncbi:hypothetical protein EV356DRAFT_496582 [Viridothelium virens]|uniref:Autophagy-related protein 29 n=1 Tax=Viridothelium virens TaxID=1048519 RepID=A0A6A6GTU9_VIRVR|nr:hypothetical protein EV356DRAFT_496582 [Viridothelium virens]
MAPSNQQQTAALQRRGSHGRQSSGDPTGLHLEGRNSKKSCIEPDVHYTVFLRLPFTRGDFVDPLPVDWDAAKDKALWKIISRASNSKDLNWDELSTKFQVTLPFLLQQAAWLYERHFAQVRAQMKKVGASNAPSPVPSSGSGPIAGGIAMKRLGSGGSRAPSALSTRSKESAVQKSDGSAPSTPRPGGALSRTISKETVTQSRHFLPGGSRHPLSKSIRSPKPSQKPEQAQKIADDEALVEDGENKSRLPQSSDDSSSESSSESEHLGGRSQMFRRMPRFSKRLGAQKGDAAGDDDDEVDDEPAFLPLNNEGTSANQDPSATLRNPPDAGERIMVRQQQKPSTHRTHSQPQQHHHQRAESLGSSESSTAAGGPQSQRAPGPLSPRHRAELAKLSPRLQRGASDGTPSMGSSFSDLDDTSVTQSALEEALLSNIQNGRMGSRMSSISQALRGGSRQV